MFLVSNGILIVEKSQLIQIGTSDLVTDPVQILLSGIVSAPGNTLHHAA